MFRTKTKLEHAALAATPSRVQLAGRWTACDQDGNGGHRYLVELEQYGTAIYGTMHSVKDRTNPIIRIRGILLDERLVANTWIDRHNGMGSGTIDLNPNDSFDIMSGTSTWYTIAGSHEYCTTVWKRKLS